MSEHFMGLGCTKSFNIEFADQKTSHYSHIKFSVFEDNGECVVSIANDEYTISLDELEEIRDGLTKFIEVIYK